MCIRDRSWKRKVKNQPLELLITGQYKEVCLKIEDENEKILELAVKKGSIILKQKREEWQQRACSYQEENIWKMQIYMDYNTFEVFINDGKYVFSSRIYPNEVLRFVVDATSRDKDGRLEMYSLSL